MDMVLKTTDLTKKYGNKTVVDHVNISIGKGEIYGLIGKNGAGKTTFMRMVLDFAVPNVGSIELFGGENYETAGQRIGSLVEAPAFYGGASAFENLKRFSLLCGRDGGRSYSDAELHALIDIVGLADAGRKKVGYYSLGMKQRLGIAIAMLGDPEFLVLDEPVNGLDPAGIKDVRDTIRKLNQEKGVTFLISSHLLDELSKIATKYGILNEGKLVEEITAAELEKRCRRNITLTVDNPVRAKQLLSEMIPEEEITQDLYKLTVWSHVEESAAINRHLVTNGIEVSELNTQANDIEDFFIERIGG